MLDQELNFELVTKPEAPWYDQLREKQLVNLFNEQKPQRKMSSNDFSIPNNFVDIFNERGERNSSQKRKNENMFSDTIMKFKEQIKDC